LKAKVPEGGSLWGVTANATQYSIPNESYTERFTKAESYSKSNGVIAIQEELNKKEMDMLKGKKYAKTHKTVTNIYGDSEDIYDKELFYTQAEGAFLQILGRFGTSGEYNLVINSYRVYYNAAQVSLDFNSTKINYAFIIFTAVILMKVMLYSSIGMIMRLYKCTILFLILPGPISMSPLDDGASFKKWQKKFMGSVMAAYSVVIAVNVY
jgi:hypothetical protein